MTGLTVAADLVALAGVAQAALGGMAVHRFRARPPAPPPADRPPVSVLKPLHGDEPLLEAALATLCSQDYHQFQIVFGVQSQTDSAIVVVDRLRARFPQTDIALVIDPTPHGANRKIANLINMFPAARHDVLVIADSDVHAAPDYLDRIVATLGIPAVGLASALYTGLPGSNGLVAAAGATAITHGFLPGALLGHWLGRRDCLGATMALRRETLAAIGGLPALADHIADDHMLGRLVRDLGLEVAFTETICATTVPETTWSALFRHELRWARTVAALVPVQFALSGLQYPLFWAALGMGLSGFGTLSCVIFLLAWAARAAVAGYIDAALSRPGNVRPPRFAPAAPWLLPLRDIMSAAVMLASYRSRRVEWRGQVMHTAPVPHADAPPAYDEPSAAAAS